ncbi:MAG: RsmB/NOP family class I SAM-dependent RNA methyltransferase [Rhodobacteraceae bacterium]|nr:RsmB/NOP family class I SAM-dependent RNA methyltransferase [Paracoccaceae bacterium]
MTPAARVQAAIEILDDVQAGTAAEQALTRWGRQSRYAGSGDRAAVRDHVFSVLRCLRSFASLGGAATGRGLMIGLLKSQSVDLGAIFSGLGYAPSALSDEERASGQEPVEDAERLDVPDWIWPLFQSALEGKAEAAATALQHRAPIHCRVNLTKTDVATAIKLMADDGVICSAHPTTPTALIVTQGNRRIRQSSAYTSGLVELQDAGSQSVVNALPLRDGMRILDYCAGGGGKALAMSARAQLDLYAHDLIPERMKDLPERATRAGAQISMLTTEELTDAGLFDLVLCDAPCSGSGSWRRAPQAKWNLTPERLLELENIQYDILQKAALLTAQNGVLVYVTCSILREENVDSVNRFLKENPGWNVIYQETLPITQDTDGFFTTHLKRL